MNLVTEYSPWFILVCLLIAGATASFLYYKYPIHFDNRKKLYNILLASSRFVVLFILTLFLLNPLIKSVNKRIEKPIVIIAVDHSQSILVNKDSIYNKTEFVKSINDLNVRLGADYQVEKVQFGDKINPFVDTIYFNSKQTDISEVFTDINSRYDNLNIGALILASYGLYNKGTNPIYLTEKINFPVYTIALGDTTPQKDIQVKKIKHNEIAFIGNRFPINIEIEANDCKNERAECTLFQNGKLLFTKPITITENNSYINIPYELQANEAGVQHFVCKVTTLRNEITYTNNVKDFFVEVLDGKQKILMVAASPHPDLAALKSGIEANKNYELKTYMLSELNKITNLESYNLVILHQVPAQSNNASLFINQIKEKKIPQLYILGSLSNINNFNNSQNLLSIQTSSVSYNDAVPLLNAGFGMFTLTEESSNKFKNLPPLASPFGNYQLSKDAEVLFSQQIGYVKTNTPLMMFSKNSDTRVGVIAGEGLWRWKLTEYAQSSNVQAYEELISKTIQYLSVKEDKRPFRLVNFQKFFYENEPITFDAELHNETYEMVNSSDVSLDLIDENGKKYPYEFSKSGNAYTLNTGIFPPGNYIYHAQTELNGKKYVLDGQLSVLPLQAEMSRTVADHGLLSQLSLATQGQLFYPKQMDELYKKIKENEEIKPIIYNDRKTNDLIYFKWLFFFIVILLGIEWFVRKNQGSV